MDLRTPPSWLSFALLEQAVDAGLWAIDADSVTVWASTSMTSMLACPLDELIGASMFEFMDEAWALYARNNVARRRSGIAEQHEFCFRRKDGRELWCRLAAAPAFAPDGAYLGAVAMVTDIAAERAAELIPAEDLRYLRDVSRYVPGAVYQLVQRADGHYQFRYLSDGTRTTIGLAPQVIARPDFDLFAMIDAEDRDRVRCELEHSATSLAPLATEFWVRNLVGDRRSLFTKASPRRSDDREVAWNGVMVDMTHLRVAEAERRASEARLAAVFESLPFACWVTDRDGRYQLQNPTSIARWGDQRGKTPAETGLPREVVEPWQRANAAALAGEVVREHGELEIGGARQFFHTVVGPVRAEDEILGIAGISIDITEQERLRRRLAEAEKLEAIGRLAGGVAHDFNNLLTAIFQSCALLDVKVRDIPSGQSDVALIRECAQRAASLTRQLLAFSRRDTVEPRRIAVAEAVASMAALLQGSVGDGVELAIHATATRHAVVDPLGLERVLLNLATNARDAMPEGGRLEIRVVDERVASPRQAVDTIVPPGDYVLLEVSDTGGGMDPDTIPHIFEPFFTTRADAGGTGLGLAFCYGFVRQAFGYIAVDTQEGRGSRFCIYLPRAAEAAVSPDEPRTDDAAGDDGPVLLVDDDPLVRRSLAETLRSANLRVVEASDPTEAIAAIGELPHPPAAVVTDVRMPNGGGIALAAWLEREGAGCPLLFITGSARLPELRDYIDRGARILYKPFDPDALVATVREMLASR